MKVLLRKTFTTASERMTARTLQPDFGGIADDLGGADAPSTPVTDAPDPIGNAHACETSLSVASASISRHAHSDERQTAPG
jgi:hypothetical protein